MLTGHLHSWSRPPEQNARQPFAPRLVPFPRGLSSTPPRRCLTAAANSAPPQLKKPEVPPALEQPEEGRKTSDGEVEQAGGFWNAFSVLASSQQFAMQLLSHFSRWPGARWPGSQAEQVLQAASSMEKEKQANAVPADISPYLHAVAVWEMKHIRKLSHLCALTYLPHKVNTKSLQRRHKIDLVLSSWDCSPPAFEPRTAEEVGAEGDGMAVSVSDANKIYAAAALLLSRQPLDDEQSAGAATSGRDGGASSGGGYLQGSSKAVTDVVAAKLAEAAMAASAAAAAAASPLASVAGVAAAAASPLASAAGSLYAGLASLPLPGLRGSDAGAGANSGGGSGGGDAGVSVDDGMAAGSGGSNGGDGGSGGFMSGGRDRAADARSNSSSSSSSSGGSGGSGGSRDSSAGPTGLPSVSQGGTRSQPFVTPPSNLDEARTTISIPTIPALATAMPTAAPQPSSPPSPSSTLPSTGTGTGAGPLSLSPSSSASSAPPAAASRLSSALPSFATPNGFASPASAAAAGPSSTTPSLGRALTGSPSSDPSQGSPPSSTSSPSGAALAVTPATATGTSLVALPGIQPPPSTCPSEWFVCDDPVHHTRIFAIQGSDTIDHWRLNLTFDPVTFEDPALGVTVHRGVYEAAKVLYEKFLPLIYEHLDSSPFARITFTGHSIGGSMAVLLMLMYKRRGVLTNRSISTVYTFGAPSVFCENPTTSWMMEGDYGDQSLGSWDGALQPPCVTGGPSRLLSALGLKEQAVRNVMMSKDIVPRAFACDYSLVAELLKSWGPAFKQHTSLALDGRKHLYYFVGRMIVLQPDPWHTFVASDPDHPLLPPGPGLYYIAEPSDMLVPKPRGVGSVGSVGGVGSVGMGGVELQVVSAANAGGNGSGKGGEKAASPAPAAAAVAVPADTGRKALVRRPKVPSSARAALMELMDCPHPLETLADPGAYLDTGSISRYHNPDNYTLAFGRLIYLRRKQELTAAGRPVTLWALAGRATGAGAGREDGWEGGGGDQAPAGVASVEGVGVWDSSDDFDASPNPILFPAESNLFT